MYRRKVCVIMESNKCFEIWSVLHRRLRNRIKSLGCQRWLKESDGCSVGLGIYGYYVSLHTQTCFLYKYKMFALLVSFEETSTV